ncbi:uncharacterized protein ARMOST_21129 [Armillaria ostoyae]|uniref:Uncharacterized protein n=1 Tax=Armillaria ostoyae TaxID=47428 RepID=A0A284S983_ARMOS|nr:uncharacterized protein ARMOST_21129 [Armillaria ostoyae]
MTNNDLHTRWCGWPRKYFTEEEKKDARAVIQVWYYGRNREDINADMRHRYHTQKPSNIAPSPSTTSASMSNQQTLCVQWLRQIRLHRGQLMALTGNNAGKYIGHLCSGFLCTQDESMATLEDALSKVKKIYDDANGNLQMIYSESGVSPVFHEVEEVIKRMEDIKQQVQDVLANAMLGRQELRRLHTRKLLLYQTS